MSNKEILFKALRNETTPRPAWVPFVGSHGGNLIGVSAKDYLTDADHIVKGLTRAAERYQPDGLPVVFDLQIEAEIIGCELEWAVDTPPAVRTHPLSDAQLNSLPPITVDAGRFPMIADVMARLKPAIGGDVALYGLITGPFTLALHLIGNAIFLKMFDDKDWVLQVLEYCRDFGKKAADFYLDHGADVVAVVDPMTSQISPKHFDTFVTPFVNAIFDRIRERGAYSSMFVCGDATRVLEKMFQTTSDNVSVDENISLSYCRELAAEYDKSFGGNMKLTSVLLLGNEDAAKMHAIECIDTGGTKGYVLAPGCDLPFGVPEKNIAAVAEMVRDDYKRDVARQSLKYIQADNYDDIVLPDYGSEPNVIVDIITLDSSSCAPCQYMVNAVNKAVEKIDDVVEVREHKITSRNGIGMMARLGVKNVPTICIDGETAFSSIIPDEKTLRRVIEEKIQAKNGETGD